MQDDTTRKVTAEDVVWCYRFLLNREPESTQVVEESAALAPDIQSLVDRFVGSREFSIKHGLAPPPLDGPAMRVDLEVSPEQLQTLRDRVGKAWAEMGEATPHYSVLTGDEYLPQNLSASVIERFYESGVTEGALIKAILDRNDFGDTGRKICVEYGCGLGRVTLAIAKHFGCIYGYDISPPHLKLAEERRLGVNCDNAEFILWKDLQQEIKPCDFFYSRIVFQHNPPPLILRLIESALSSLNDGGVAVFQAPTYGANYAFDLEAYLAADWQPSMEMHCIPQSAVFEAIDKAGCHLLEVRDDGATGKLGWLSNLFVVRRPAR